MSDPTKELILDTLKNVIDDKTGKDVVSLDMVTGLVIKGRRVGFALNVMDREPKSLEPLRQKAEDAINALSEVTNVTVALTAERDTANERHPEDDAPRKKAEPPRPEPIAGVKKIIAIGSGKGGVGKSTTSVNVAIALKEMGLNVGLLDADLYGPSIPKMLGSTERPKQVGETTIAPVDVDGLKVMSMGFLIPENSPIIWRGAMVGGALKQMFTDVMWGDLDVLILDLPPGTGDIQITIVQSVPIDAAVIVSTPQDIALIDGKKGLEMFRKVEVPHLCMVENMSYFLCPSCGDRSEIFGHGGARETAEAMDDVNFLGEVPLHIDVRTTSDEGTPIVTSQPDSAEAKAFKTIAENLAKVAELKTVN